MHMMSKTNDVDVDKWSLYDIRHVKIYIGKTIFMGYHQVLSFYHLMIGVTKSY